MPPVSLEELFAREVAAGQTLADTELLFQFVLTWLIGTILFWLQYAYVAPFVIRESFRRKRPKDPRAVLKRSKREIFLGVPDEPMTYNEWCDHIACTTNCVFIVATILCHYFFPLPRQDHYSEEIGTLGFFCQPWTGFSFFGMLGLNMMFGKTTVTVFCEQRGDFHKSFLIQVHHVVTTAMTSLTILKGPNCVNVIVPLVGFLEFGSIFYNWWKVSVTPSTVSNYFIWMTFSNISFVITEAVIMLGPCRPLYPVWLAWGCVVVATGLVIFRQHKATKVWLKHMKQQSENKGTCPPVKKPKHKFEWSDELKNGSVRKRQGKN